MNDFPFIDQPTAKTLRAAFQEIGAAAETDPLVNPVETLASRLFLALERGQISVGALDAIIGELEQAGFETRAAAFHEARREQPDIAAHLSEQWILRSSERAVERTPVGVVFTAHPTFALTCERREADRFL